MLVCSQTSLKPLLHSDDHFISCWRVMSSLGTSTPSTKFETLSSRHGCSYVQYNCTCVHHGTIVAWILVYNILSVWLSTRWIMVPPLIMCMYGIVIKALNFAPVGVHLVYIGYPCRPNGRPWAHNVGPWLLYVGVKGGFEICSLIVFRLHPTSIRVCPNPNWAPWVGVEILRSAI